MLTYDKRAPLSGNLIHIFFCSRCHSISFRTWLATSNLSSRILPRERKKKVRRENEREKNAPLPPSITQVGKLIFLTYSLAPSFFLSRSALANDTYPGTGWWINVVAYSLFGSIQASSSVRRCSLCVDQIHLYCMLAGLGEVGSFSILCKFIFSMLLADSGIIHTALVHSQRVGKTLDSLG